MHRPAPKLRWLASVHHDNGTSIPVSLFEELCAAGERPSALYREFNRDAGTHIDLFPLLTTQR
jgi:hypothetical protein